MGGRSSQKSSWSAKVNNCTLKKVGRGQANSKSRSYETHIKVFGRVKTARINDVVCIIVVARFIRCSGNDCGGGERRA